MSESPASEITGDSSPTNGVRQITLELVKQSANRAMSPVAQLGQLQVTLARQHVKDVESDYFPKFGASFENLHATEFLGQLVTIRRPFRGEPLVQVPAAIIGQNQTFAGLTVVQPITPIFTIRQAVRIARADERVAMAKAGAAASKNTRDAEIEETYFKLLIAQEQVRTAELKLKHSGGPLLLAAAYTHSVATSDAKPDLVEAAKDFTTAAAKVKELSASINRSMGWPDDTKLELSRPDPLIENVSLDEIANKPVAVSPELVEAEENVVKARAAARVAKLAYIPTVAAVSGYLFQNVLPAVSSNFGYGGVIASYTLFDFGKRERGVKEAQEQVEMAELALQVTKAKLSADLKKSYYELERSRQLSQVVQKMGSSVAVLMDANSPSESIEVKEARVQLELQMVEADLVHRQAFAHLQTLMGSQ